MILFFNLNIGKIEGGDWAPIQSVMVDAGRIQPTTVESRRSTTPALDAGRALASALRVDPANVTVRTTPAGGQQLAAVQSPPLIERLREMMGASDNVMAESVNGAYKTMLIWRCVPFSDLSDLKLTTFRWVSW